ncbi:MAG: peptidylprolyl isomerase [Gammaproteobacteria bacterium]|nr:peptidylprolyl isomerase [Gammaproteobacteria bacterium]
MNKPYTNSQSPRYGARSLCDLARRFMLAISIVSMMLIAGIGHAETQDVDRILVIINDEVITQSELEHQMRKAKQNIAQQKITAPSDDLIRKQVLERIIVEKIQLQLAQRMGMIISDKELEDTINRIIEGNKLSQKEFYKKIEQEGTELSEFRDELRQQLLLQKLVDQQIKRRISVSENEVDQFLHNRDRLLGGSDAYNLSHIMIPIPESASPAKLQELAKRAQEILGKLESGEGFQQTAIAYSRGQEALEGGNLGWRSAGQLPELFATALAKMKPGEISGVLRSPNGFHILKLNDRRSSKTSKTVTQIRARHILLPTNDVLPESDTLKKIESIRQRIINGEDFATMAKSYSQDPLSAVKGGDLGWINPGEMVPEFENALTQLETGKVSQPVHTPFGYHLIQVQERRQQDIGEKLDRAEARKQIHGRKADELYQQWIRQLRDESYIKYLSDEDTDS